MECASAINVSNDNGLHRLRRLSGFFVVQVPGVRFGLAIRPPSNEAPSFAPRRQKHARRFALEFLFSPERGAFSRAERGASA